MGALWLAAAMSLAIVGAQSTAEPHGILREADRLAWLRAWGAAERHFVEARKLLSARGDERNAL